MRNVSNSPSVYVVLTLALDKYGVSYRLELCACRILKMQFMKTQFAALIALKE